MLWGNTCTNSECDLSGALYNWSWSSAWKLAAEFCFSHLQGMSATQNVVQELKHTHDFMVDWCSIKNSWWSLAILTFAPQAPYVAMSL